MRNSSRICRSGWVSSLAAGLVLLIALPSVWAAGLEPGASMPTFSLTDVDGRAVSSESYAPAKALVVVFTTNHCPYSVAYQNRLIQLAQEYSARGVQFVLINPSDGKGNEAADAMKKRAAEKRYPFPYLADPSQGVAKAFGAARTPEVFLFGPDRKLVYRGRVDDNTEESLVRSHDLRTALDLTLAGTPQKVVSAGRAAFGCSIHGRE